MIVLLQMICMNEGLHQAHSFSWECDPESEGEIVHNKHSTCDTVSHRRIKDGVHLSHICGVTHIACHINKCHYTQANGDETPNLLT